MKEPLVKSVMSPFPYSVAAESPIARAREMMAEHRVRHLPVTRNRVLWSIVSDRDIKRLLASGVHAPAAGNADERLTVADACVEHCYMVGLDTPLSVVLETMAERHIGAALVTHRERLAGIFTTTDACRVFAEHLKRQFGRGAQGPDDAA